MHQKYFFTSNLRLSHDAAIFTGSLFTNEEQKKVGSSSRRDPSATHADLVHDVADTSKQKVAALAGGVTVREHSVTVALLAKPLWIDPGLKSGISARELISA